MSNVDQGLTAGLTAVLVSTIALLAGGQVLFKRAANVIDGRNVLDPRRWQQAGWNYQGMGRGVAAW